MVSPLPPVPSTPKGGSSDTLKSTDPVAAKIALIREKSLKRIKEFTSLADSPEAVSAFAAVVHKEELEEIEKIRKEGSKDTSILDNSSSELQSVDNKKVFNNKIDYKAINPNKKKS